MTTDPAEQILERLCWLHDAREPPTLTPFAGFFGLSTSVPCAGRETGQHPRRQSNTRAWASEIPCIFALPQSNRTANGPASIGLRDSLTSTSVLSNLRLALGGLEIVDNVIDRINLRTMRNSVETMTA